MIAGGTSLAEGYIEEFNKKLVHHQFPINIKIVRHAKDPLRAVSKGCLIASKIL